MTSRDPGLTALAACVVLILLALAAAYAIDTGVWR